MEKINNRDSSKDSLHYSEDKEQVLFRIFGIEMTAPKGLKNPRIIYISFILINIFLLVFIKNLISN